ncbi:kinesin-like protein KIF14 [Microcaecilia unicolor]|uniref:Kinesin-like protein KIF14 n=1 Tax=Microcaecilia unicolor TaxID=1415580 RepID=A0A6P7YLD7_9AMPH|nr:kinesin-like protein KIF14 [Microcaecilia unicolor]
MSDKPKKKILTPLTAVPIRSQECSRFVSQERDASCRGHNFAFNGENISPFTPETSQNISFSALTTERLLYSTLIADGTSEMSLNSFDVPNENPQTMPGSYSLKSEQPQLKATSKVATSSVFLTLQKKKTDETDLCPKAENEVQESSHTTKKHRQPVDAISVIKQDLEQSSKNQKVIYSPTCLISEEAGQKVPKSRLPLAVRTWTGTSPKTDKINEIMHLGSKTRVATNTVCTRNGTPTEVADVEDKLPNAGSFEKDLGLLTGGMTEETLQMWRARLLSQSPVIADNEFPLDCSLELDVEDNRSHLAVPERFHDSSVMENSWGEDSAVIVAVRVRPFNKRENQGRAKCVASCTGQEIQIRHPFTHQVFAFFYDFTFLSLNPGDATYASQEDVYSQLAQPLLDKVFDGYNVCLFAYGQTGSGKSYTMMGYNEDPGIIPRFCEELFTRVNVVQQDVKYHIEMSYFEIYNERIYDLLTSPRESYSKKRALKVREKPNFGPYVSGLSTYVVASFTDVQTWLELGNKQRATAATSINDKSSRSHSVFSLTMKQTKREHLDGEVLEHMVMSRVNLVDLAGSERCDSAQTSGIRLKEGASINKSLLTLGKVISALSEMSQSKRKIFIPYRDSILTWLLKESLGGNSKTAMMATVGPAAMNVDETLSTLRYASQARNIINSAKINEDANAKLVRDLKAEIEKLQCSQGIDILKYKASLQEIKSLKELLSAQEKEMAEAQKSWQEKLHLAEKCKIEEAKELQKAGICFKVDNRLPNLVNLNEDPQLSEVLLYMIKEGQTRVGKYHPDSNKDIQLTGALISDEHCCITNIQEDVTLSPVLGAETYINGNLILEPVTLHHGDRVILGGQHYFRFNHPMEVKRGRRAMVGTAGVSDGLRDYEFAKNELIEAQKQRIESEIDDARLQAQKEMMQELQVAKDLAQRELSAQKNLYESRIKQLEKKLEEEMNKKHCNKHGDVLRQQHLVPTLLLSQDLEIRIRQSKFMNVLQQEKKRLSDEVEKLQSSKDKNAKTLEKHAHWGDLRLSITLQEANIISKNQNKETVFTRYDLPAIDGETTTVCVRVTNTKLGISTLWSSDKFENKLVSMRELYQGSFEGSGDDLFYDPNDTWEAEVKPPSPNRRHSLSRQTSEKLLGKVSMDMPAFDSSCAAICKQMVSSTLEAFVKEGESSSPVLKLLTDLQTVMSSSAHVSQVYQQLDESTSNVASDVSIQPYCIKISSAVGHITVSIQLLESVAPVAGSWPSFCKDSLVAEVKRLGRNITFLLHGCECEIVSMIMESKEQIDQSVVIIAGSLGRLTIAMGAEMNCGLERAESITSCIKNAFIGGMERYINFQMDMIVSELLDVQKSHQNIPSGNKLGEIQNLLCLAGASLQSFMRCSRRLWKEIISIKDQKMEKPLSLQECFLYYKTLSFDLRRFLSTWKLVTTTALQCLKDLEQGFPKLKQDTDMFSKTAVLLCKTFSSLYCAVDDSRGQSMCQVAVMTKTETAASEILSYVRDLLQVIEALESGNDLNSGMGTQKNNKQSPMGLQLDTGRPLWGRSGNSVRVAVAMLNRQVLTKEMVTHERKGMV